MLHGESTVLSVPLTSVEFLDESIQQTDSETDMISFQLVYEKYVSHCENNYRKTMGKQKFYKKLRKWVTKKGTPISVISYGNREMLQSACLFTDTKTKN